MHDSRRLFLTRSGSFSQRAYGALLLVLGLVAIIAPFSAGEWAISILGLVVLVAGAAEVIQGLRSRSPSLAGTTYLTGLLMIQAGLLLFVRPFLVIGGLLALLALIMTVDGVTKMVSAFRNKLGQASADRFAGAIYRWLARFLRMARAPKSRWRNERELERKR